MGVIFGFFFQSGSPCVTCCVQLHALEEERSSTSSCVDQQLRASGSPQGDYCGLQPLERALPNCRDHRAPLPPPLPTSLLRGFSSSATTRLQTATSWKEASFKALGQEEDTGWVTQSPECLTPVASLCQQNSICFPCCVD